MMSEPRFAQTDVGIPVTGDLTSRQFGIGVVALSVFYLAIQLAYIARQPLVMDEFQGAHALHQFAGSLPYRDFQPYKTVLGYYVQLPALMAVGDPWTGMLAVKLQAAVLTAITLGIAAWRLQRHFRRSAVVFALLLLVCLSTFLERSSELRVDMLTSIAGLVSLLFLLGRRFAWAGVACGVSILVSQKGVYYALSGVVALGVYWLTIDRGGAAFANILRFTAATVGTLFGYLAFWSVLASPTDVYRATFVAPRTIALDLIYDMRLWGWQRTLKPNPIYYALAVAALLGLAERCLRLKSYRDTVLLTYGLVLIALCIWHRQPWPYFFVLLIPTLFVLHAALFDLETDRHRRAGTRPAAPLVGLVLAIGIILPLKRIPHVLARDNAFQRETVRVIDSMLQPGDTYLAGVNLLHDRDQAVPELAWLDARRLTELRNADPRRIETIGAALDRAPVKLYVHNYRLEGLPAALRERLDTGFSHLWGNVFIYSPTVESTAEAIDLKFDGAYIVREASGPVTIDRRTLQPGDTIVLARGRHQVDSRTDFRLTFAPPLTRSLAAEYQEPRDFFPNVYTY